MSEIHVIQSVQRAINIINCFTEHQYSLTLNEISQKVDLNINTTRGLVQTLVLNDVLSYDKEKKLYSLGYYFNAKSKLVNNNISFIVNVCSPFLHKISQELKVACGLQIVQGETVRTIYYEEPDDSCYHIIGNEYIPLPLHATASGKLLLAYSLIPVNPDYIHTLSLNKFTGKTIVTPSELLNELNNIKKQGYATENDEFESSIYSVAVPLFNVDGLLFASASISGITSELHPKEKALIEKLLKAKKGIENKMHGYSD